MKLFMRLKSQTGWNVLTHQHLHVLRRPHAARAAQCARDSEYMVCGCVNDQEVGIVSAVFAG